MATNPFLTSAKITVLRKEYITNRVVNVEQGVSRIEQSVTDYRDIEVDEFVKLYRISYQLGLLKEMNAIGCRMYLYVQAKLKPEYDYIYLKREKVMKDLELSHTSVGSGIQNLVDVGILCKKSQSEYWINPVVLFNGDRKQYFKKYAPKNITYIKDNNPSVSNIT